MRPLYDGYWNGIPLHFLAMCGAQSRPLECLLRPYNKPLKSFSKKGIRVIAAGNKSRYARAKVQNFRPTIKKG
jgi:hypothetical protein